MLVYIITLFQILGLSCFSALLWFSIQPGQFLGFWQKKLRDFDLKGHNTAWHFLGGCSVCTAHFIALCSIPLYVYFTWDFDQLIIRCFFYNFIAAVSNYLFITKLFGNE